ncbi:MAG: RnfH family protein [Betaproteobacteria bacterium]|nr:RnfH family protein [Betaproteobacteria bacterium]
MADGVRVVYAPAGAAPVEVELRAAPGMTLADAVHASGLRARFAQIDLEHARVGVWGKPRDPSSLACPGDRIEIYRPLTADPKASRSQRAKKKAAEK